MKYKHIVFDIDGTMVDNEYAILCSLYSALLKIDFEVTEMDDLLFALGIPGEIALQELGVPDIKTAFKVWVEELESQTIATQLFEDIEELLMALKNQGYQLGIVTSKNEEYYLREEDIYGIDKYFDIYVFAESTEKPKPHAEPLLKYLELAECTAEEVLYIGDSIYDLQCAQNAGVDFALVHWGAPRKTTFAGFYNLETPLQLLELI